MNYELQVYICDGTVSEKLKWFRTINTAGVPLTEQELLNAQYTGAWLSDAKSYFSRNNSGAATYTVVPNSTAKKYLALSGNNAINRQGLLQTAILWATAHDKLPKRTPDGDSYMSRHQGDDNAQELESYFNSVFDWVGSKFKKYRKEEKGLETIIRMVQAHLILTRIANIKIVKAKLITSQLKLVARQILMVEMHKMSIKKQTQMAQNVSIIDKRLQLLLEKQITNQLVKVQCV